MQRKESAPYSSLGNRQSPDIFSCLKWKVTRLNQMSISTRVREKSEKLLVFSFLYLQWLSFLTNGLYRRPKTVHIAYNIGYHMYFLVLSCSLLNNAPQGRTDTVVGWNCPVGRGRGEGWWNGAATLRWILQQLHSKTVLAHISAFPNKCTTKHPFHTTDIHEKSGNLWKLHYSVLSGKKNFLQYNINSEPCKAYYTKWFK